MTQWSPGKIAQFFVQDGKKITFPSSTYADGAELNQEWCDKVTEAFDDRPRFTEVGGFAQMDKAHQSPMVLVMSLWDDVSLGPPPPRANTLTDMQQHYANMLWLDATYPPEKAGQPGGDRGDCAADSGVPKEVESTQADVRILPHDLNNSPTSPPPPSYPHKKG